MMTKTLIRTVQQGGQPDAGGSVVLTAGADADIDLSVANGANNQAVVYAMTISKLVLFCLVSDQAITVTTNSSGSPVNTFTLAAGAPFIWASGDAPMHDTGGTAVTTNITELFVTNSSGSAANFKLRSLYNP